MASDRQFLDNLAPPEIFKHFMKAAPSNPAPDIQTQFNTLSFTDTPENLNNFDLNNDGEFTPEDFVSPKTPQFIEKPEDLFDEELISQELGMPVMILDSQFGGKVFGTKDNPNTELRDIAYDMVKGNEIPDQAKQELAKAFEETIRAAYPQHARAFDQVQDSFFYEQAAISYQILKNAEGEPVPGAGSIAAYSRRMMDSNDEMVGNTITVNNQDDIDWQTANPTAEQYAGQEINYPYPIEYRQYEIMGEEIEHAHQFKNEYDAYFNFTGPETYTELYNNTTQIMETGGRMAGIETAKKLVEQQEGPQAADKYAEFSSSMNQATTFHITLRQTATKGAEDVGSIRGYAYDRNLDRIEETGEFLDPDQLSETRVALADEVLAPYEIDSQAKQNAFSDFVKDNTHPTFQHVKTRLQEVVNDESISPEMQEMAASELDALDTIGIDRGDVEAHAAEWQQFWQNNGYDYIAEQELSSIFIQNFSRYTSHQNGLDNSLTDQAVNIYEDTLAQKLETMQKQGFLNEFREDLIEKASQQDPSQQDNSELDKQDYREVFDKFARDVLGKQTNAQPSAEADIMPG